MSTPPARTLVEAAGLRVLLVDAIPGVGPGDRGLVVVSGSHGGRSARALALGHDLSGGGLQRRRRGQGRGGRRGPAILDGEGTPAGAVDHRTARIGDARDTWEESVLSHGNDSARRRGLAPGQRVREAVPRASE